METKECAKCKQIKLINEFHKHKTSKNGICSICKICHRKDRREYYLKNRDSDILASMSWRKNNPEKAKLSLKRFYEKHPNKAKEYGKKRYNIARNKWIELLSKHNYTTCKICGFNKDFCAIDLHHVNGNKDKVKVSMFFQGKITEERLNHILTECIPLCANCHRMIHYLEEFGGEEIVTLLN